MGKLTTYVLVLTGVSLLLHITGILGAGEGSTLLSMALDPQSITLTSIASLVLVGIGSLAAGAGLLALTSSRILQFDLLAATGLSVFLFSLAQDIIFLWIKISAYSNSYFASLLISPFIVLFPIIVFEFWRGRG
jgi:hypothetical protein